MYKRDFFFYRLLFSWNILHVRESIKMTLCFILNTLFAVKLVNRVAAMTLGEMGGKKKRIEM